MVSRWISVCLSAHFSVPDDNLTAESRSGCHFVPWSCYALETHNLLIINKFRFYILIAEVSGFLTISHY